MIGSMGARILFSGSMLFTCSYRFDPFAQLLIRWIFWSVIGSTPIIFCFHVSGRRFTKVYPVGSIAASMAGSGPDLGSVYGWFRSGSWQHPRRVPFPILPASRVCSDKDLDSAEDGFFTSVS